jgi:glycosyltransferase involved in cell wall biosynthesis
MFLLFGEEKQVKEYMYKLEVLIATMFKENKNDIIDLLNVMNINSDAIVVSQCNKNGIEKFNYKNFSITCIYSIERGLSRSRNLALYYATADIITIADDDFSYYDNYAEIVINAHTINPEYDILTFKVKDDKKYFPAKKKLNKLLIHKVASNEITMKLASVKNISFNILFGAGSSCFLCGEENIFLNSCLKKKKKVMYIPQKIGYLREDTRSSSWFSGYNKEYMISHGAAYYELSHFLVLPYILQFAIRKYSLYKKNINIFLAIYYMLIGISKYRKILNSKKGTGDDQK